MPVQVYSSSPINASKATTGVSPKTAPPEDAEARTEAPTTTTTTTTMRLPGAPEPYYAPAQPEARPALPVQTAASAFPNNFQPTPTQTGVSPPPPQPGAVPSPPGAHHVPPPPKAGEPNQQPQQPRITAAPMPPQLYYAAPQPSYAAQAGSSTASAALYASTSPKPTTLLQGEDTTRTDYSHPPGYQQNIHAAEFTSDQRAAHNASVAQGAYQGSDESVWTAAKKWAAAASDGLAAAENEIWKRINKD